MNKGIRVPIDGSHYNIQQRMSFLVLSFSMSVVITTLPYRNSGAAFRTRTFRNIVYVYCSLCAKHEEANQPF